VALVAGGQGSRLGFEHPKGMYPIGPISGASLFRILLEKILAVGRTYGVRVPLYLMTSPATDDETRSYLQQHECFGLDHDDVFVFCQGTMPAVDADTGRLLLADKGRLFQSPDGHGGMLAAMDRTGALKDMQRRGLRHLFYFQVDNPLATVCDPEFIGYHLLSGSQYTLQVISKQTPRDKVGNVVSVDGTVRVIEYSDLPDEAAELRNEDGSLKIWAGSIAVHVFDIAFLADCAQEKSALPFHLARKKVAYVDSTGQQISPTSPNAIKFEQFIFDLLPLAERTISVEVDAAEAFAPLKNAPGAAIDTPQAVQSQMMALHREWLQQAGAHVADGVQVEISPLFALDADQLALRLDPGATITKDIYFS
jgi:UDP-N-acetylglucosamine/UDP-N-acetylgalactosamine diphosphorylase